MKPLACLMACFMFCAALACDSGAKTATRDTNAGSNGATKSGVEVSVERDKSDSAMVASVDAEGDSPDVAGTASADRETADASTHASTNSTDHADDGDDAGTNGEEEADEELAAEDVADTGTDGAARPDRQPRNIGRNNGAARQQGNSPQPARPRMPPLSGSIYEIAEPQFDFGEVWQGDAVRHEFIIRNTSQQELQIVNGKVDCHCTSLKWDKKIAPGESGKVGFVINTAGLGRTLYKGATFTTNDPQRPTFRVVMTGKVLNVCKMTPNDGGSFREIIDENAERSRKIVIESQVKEPITFELIPSPRKAKFFNVDVEELTPGKKWRLTLSTVPPLAAGMKSERFVFKTGHARKPTFEVTASYFRPERIAAKPMNLRFPYEVKNEIQGTKTVEITNHGDNPVKLLSAVVVDDPDFTTEIEEIAPGKRFKVTIKAPAGYKLEKNRKLLITTDDAEMKQIDLSVYCTPDERNLAQTRARMLAQQEANKNARAPRPPQDGATPGSPGDGTNESGDGKSGGGNSDNQ